MTNRWYGAEMTKLIHEDVKAHENKSKKARKSSTGMF